MSSSTDSTAPRCTKAAESTSVDRLTEATRRWMRSLFFCTLFTSVSSWLMPRWHESMKTGMDRLFQLSGSNPGAMMRCSSATRRDSSCFSTSERRAMTAS